MTEAMIRPLEKGDAPAVNALFRDVFGVERSLETWRWLFREGPAGPALAVIAEKDEQVVGHAATILREGRIDQERAVFAQSIDAMTHPDHQKQGVNARLEEEWQEHPQCVGETPCVPCVCA